MSKMPSVALCLTWFLKDRQTDRQLDKKTDTVQRQIDRQMY